MSFLGQDVIDVGSTRVGQKYVLGAQVSLDNPNWQGPWDCAEFTSWCVFQAYGMIFGAGSPPKVSKAEPFSDFWFSEAKKNGITIFIERAQQKLATAKTKVNGFSGNDWRIALWIMDIMHQGRGNFARMTDALASSDPEAALKKIGLPSFKNRVNTVAVAVEKLAESGVMNGFKV